VACRINDYSTAQVAFLSERQEGNFARVQTLFKGDKAETFIQIQLVNRSGNWLMYDAVVDGVSLVENYRAQFAQLLRTTSYVGLVGRIEAKLLLQKSFERTVSPDTIASLPNN
jgi:phospholipid transport system substrate-binding protein